MKQLVVAFAAFAINALGACSIPNNSFAPSPDAGDQIHGTGVLAIVPSVTALDVTERSSSDFTISLSQAPAAPLTVSMATDATTALALSTPSLTFDASNFDQPQTVSATGLADADTSDATAPISITAPGVDAVTIAATIHDPDKVTVATDVGAASVITVDEGGNAVLHVHLTAQPSSNVTVQAILGAGPVAVSPMTRVFTADNYDADQTFTFTAPADSNTISEDESVTFRATGVADAILSIHDVDHDVQNIQVSPTSATITEQGAAATLNVSLTQQPSRNVTVTIATTTGQASIDTGTLTFTPQNYNTPQPVKASAPDDADTANGSDTIVINATDPDAGTPLSRSVAITIKDNDVQQILENAPDPLSLTETTTASFAATLKFKPSANVIVSVTSLDTSVAQPMQGTLTFTPADYDMPHSVTVKGVKDANLATNTTSIRLFEASIGMTDVPVSVADVDHQVIQLSTSSVNIPEGSTGTFGVSLGFDPGTTVTVNLADTNMTALPIDKTSLTFTSANFGAQQIVTIHPPVDSNNVGEMATITVSGASAPQPATLTAQVMDSTQIAQYGFPTPFTGSSQLPLGPVVAYRIHVDATSNVDSFGIYVPVANGDFRMALYQDVGGTPGALVAQMPVRIPLASGSNAADIVDVNTPIGFYWVAVRTGQTTAIGFSDVTVTGPQCIRDVNITSLDDPWPAAFGSATCGNARVLNLWTNNYHQ